MSFLTGSSIVFSITIWADVLLIELINSINPLLAVVLTLWITIVRYSSSYLFSLKQSPFVLLLLSFIWAFASSLSSLRGSLGLTGFTHLFFRNLEDWQLVWWVSLSFSLIQRNSRLGTAVLFSCSSVLVHRSLSSYFTMLFWIVKLFWWNSLDCW